MDLDTIAAISTPLGAESGVGMIRVSGPRALSFLKGLFKPTNKGNFTTHVMKYGWIMDGGKAIDEVMTVYLKAPSTYTGEDIVEIFCHGGPTVLKHVLGLVIRRGARLAERGEFTKRALLNGKLDLSKAEAVIDLIKAKTRHASLAAASHLKGALSSRINHLKGALIALLVGIEASIDFPDEIREVGRNKLSREVLKTSNEIQALIKTADLGRVLREGVRVAIVGRPNVGKSSILNALIKYERAIVSITPGTTRDTIEETLNIKGIPVVMIDTAGIRRTRHDVESLGIGRAINEMEEADLILVVLDGSHKLTQEDREILIRIGDRKHIVVINKADKPGKLQASAYLSKGKARPILLSALTGDGVNKLEAAIYKTFARNLVVAENRDIMVNLRQKEALQKASKALNNALDSIKRHAQSDFLAIDIKGAISALGMVTGETVSEETISAIFDRFCVGK